MIHNLLLPICKECAHFTGTLNPAKFGVNKCKIFGAKELVSGKIKYENASACRRSDTKCGTEASFFYNNNNSTNPVDNTIKYSAETNYRANYFRDTTYRVLLKYPYFD